MKHNLKSRLLSLLVVCAMVLSLCPAVLAADTDGDSLQAAATVTPPTGNYLISQTDYTIVDGVTQSHVTMNTQDGTSQVRAVVTTIEADAPVTLKASYSTYYSKGSTEESRAKKAQNLPYNMVSTTRQAAAYEAATGETVVVATNGDYYNMQTGQPLGYLIMEGNVIQESNGSAQEPYFAVLKDGSYAIREYGTDTSDVEEAISGPFLLVKDGEIAVSQDNSLAPRNSIGLTADGDIVMILADGRQSLSVGYSCYDVAEMLLAAGCVNAIYLDGGGSATVAARNEGSSSLEIQNTPSDGTERVVSSALLVVDKSQPTGIFDHAALTPNNELYIAGASVQFSASGVDTASYVTDLPEDAAWALEDTSYGTIDAETGLFQSNGTCGTVTVNLTSGGKVVGTTTIDIQEPDEGSFGFSAESLNLSFNATSDLGLTASYSQRSIDLTGADIQWEITSTTEGVTADQIGTITDNILTTKKSDNEMSATITATYTRQDGTVLTDSIDIVVGKMPEILFDFEPDEDGNLQQGAEYAWGQTYYGNTFGDEDTEYTYMSFYNDEDGNTVLGTVTNTGPITFGGSYIADSSDVTYNPACYVLGSAGYTWMTWHTTYMKEHSATVEVTDEISRFGDYSLKLNYDYTDLISGYKNVNEYLYYCDTDPEAATDLYHGVEIEGTPTGFGVWVYAPEGTANFWLWTTVSYYDSASDSYKRKTVHFTTQEGRNIQYNGIYWEGWMYVEADLSEFAQYISEEHPLKILNGQPIIQLTFIPGGSANENGSKIPMGDFTSGSIYFDNFRVVYGDTVDDMENPVVTSIKANKTAITSDGSAVITSNDITITTDYYDPEGDNASGIDSTKTTIAVDGVNLTLSEAADATGASATVTLANGTHNVKVTISDVFGNVTTENRYFTVNAASSTLATMTLTGDDTAQLGGTYQLTLSGENNTGVTSVSATLKTNDAFGTPTVEFSSGYTGTYTYDSGTLTISATAETPTAGAIATITYQVAEDLTRGTNLECTINGSYQDGSTTLTFAQNTKTVGVTAAYEISADVMMVGSTGKIYVTDASGNAASGIKIYEIVTTTDEETGETSETEELVGKTNRDGILVTNRFCQTQSEPYTIIARGDDGLSFRYTGYTSDMGDGSSLPWDIKLNAGEDNTTAQSITWFATPQYTTQAAVVEYMTQADYDAGSTEYITVSGTSVINSFTTDNRAVYLNTVELTGLEPGTTYVYRVGDGTASHWSEYSTFTTSAANTDTSFFIIGDTQLSGDEESDADDIEALHTIAANINSAGVDFGIQTGDFVDDAGSYTQWNEILDVFTEDYAETPVVQVMGNHEYYVDTTGSNGNAIFDLPDEDYYSVEYGNVYVAVINCNADLQEAAEWLKEDAQNSSCTWKILTVHQPPYYTNPKGSSAAYNEYLPSACQEAGIDFVFSGHDHAYARTEPLTDGEVDTENGVVYVICGDLGEKSRSSEYAADDNPDFHFASLSQDYEACYLLASTSSTTTTTTFTITAYDKDGTAIDSYSVTHELENPCPDGHTAQYDRTSDTVTCTVCGQTLTEYTGYATDKDSGKQMYFMGGVYQTGWFVSGSDILHFSDAGLMHEVTVVEDIPTTCSEQGHKTVRCTDCGEEYTIEYNRATGHRYTEYTSEDGETYYICSGCGKISLVNVPFLDIEGDEWFAEDVAYCYQNGYVYGISSLYFGTGQELTRAALVTMLHRMEGEPDLNNTQGGTFTDVDSGKWYTAAVNWASENGIVDGYPDGTFKPDQSITRQELITVMWRYAKYKGYDIEISDEYMTAAQQFTDYDDIADYAQEYVAWGVGNGILKGYTDGSFQPETTTTREVATAIVHRFVEKFAPSESAG